MEDKRVVVIGAGIAGLACAHFLRRRGVAADVIERERFAGGSVRSVIREERYLLEMGPNAFLGSAEPIAALARDLSIDGQIVGTADASRNRYIFRGGRLHRLPTGPISFIASGLMSRLGRLRVFAEPFVKSKPSEGETLASFVERRLGSEVLDALVDPFVSGVWAGDPRELELESAIPRLAHVERRYGSIVSGMKELKSGSVRRGLFSFRWGMGTLAARMEEELGSRLKTGTAAVEIGRLVGGKFFVRTDADFRLIEADAVIIATPAPAAARLLVFLDAEAGAPLMSIPYAPLAVVHTAFDAKDVPTKLDGFGLLIPRGEGIRMLGSIWSSALFPSRCPEGEALLTNFIGGATDPAAVDLGDDEIIGEVCAGLSATMGIEAKPKYVSLKRWGQAIPQYTVGHKKRVEAIGMALERLPGIFLTGSYFSGISVSDTIEHARTEADRVAAYLKSIH